MQAGRSRLQQSLIGVAVGELLGSDVVHVSLTCTMAWCASILSSMETARMVPAMLAYDAAAAVISLLGC